jgi:hypothetical protein
MARRSDGTPNANSESTIQSGGEPIDTVEEQQADGTAAATWTQSIKLRDPMGNMISPMTEHTGREILDCLEKIIRLLERRN